MPRVVLRNANSPQGIGAVSLTSEGNAPIPYGKLYSSGIIVKIKPKVFVKVEE